MSQRKRKRTRPPNRYRPTPIPGLVIYPTPLLLNVAVTTPKDDAKTDGLISLETMNRVVALVRQVHDFPDLDCERGQRVVISFLNQFSRPVARLQRVSQENATRWARGMTSRIKEGVLDRFVVQGPPGPSFIMRRRHPRSTRKQP